MPLFEPFGSVGVRAPRKLRVDGGVAWDHHRGGWQRTIELIRDHLHSLDGVLFLSAVEDRIAEGQPIEEPWVGVIHQAPRTSAVNYPDLYRLVHRPAWETSIAYCQGIWTLCEYSRRFLQAWNVQVPIGVLSYPMDVPDLEFSLNDFVSRRPLSLVCIGEYLRDFRSYAALSAPRYTKTVLKPSSPDVDVNDAIEFSDVLVLDRLSELDYDLLLSHSVVYLRLYDGVAVTTVLECIMRSTPILVNPVPGVVEYLGAAYPFYYETPDEAVRKLNSMDLIEKTTQYLRVLPTRARLDDQSFLTGLERSAIYRGLPTPSQESPLFPTFDITVLICCWRRTNELPGLLERLATQTYAGNFEVVLWNNNSETNDEVRAIVARYRQRLEINIIQCDKNYYCMPRLSILSLMNSEQLLIIDDDVIPSDEYISRFVAKSQYYGPEAVLCARGHIFLPHHLDEEEPDNVWAQGQNVLLRSESDDDCRVHFMHADNCLVPKSILADLASRPPTHPEYALVDDYWMSYVLGHHLGIPVWKVRSDDVLCFSPSSEDTAVAMYHQPEVHEQRVRLYVEHMRAGWPRFNA